MMPVPKIGSTTEDEDNLGKRDAFHIPCVLAMSWDTLSPGVLVRFQDGECTRVVEIPEFNRKYSHGIVDPFLVIDIPPGELFWVFLHQSKVSDVTHHFDISDRPETDDEHTKWCESVPCD